MTKLLPPDEEELRDNVRKLLGKGRYASPSNFCWNDGYFHHWLRAQYGDARVAKMTTEVEKEGMPDQYQGVCDCRRLEKPAGTPHAPWCAFLRPPKPSDRHRPCTSDVLRQLTGGEIESGYRAASGATLHEAHEGPALGRLTLAPMTIVQPPSVVDLVIADIQKRTSAIGPESIPGEPDAVRAAYGALIDCLLDLRRYLLTRDGR